MHKRHLQGFTIVELLIVVVVIAILAAITIVSYTGLQARAQNSAILSAATQLDKKISTWHSVLGSYPSAAAVAAGLVDARVPESKIDSLLQNLIITNAAPTKDQPVAYSTCAGYVGGKIRYFVVNGSVGLINRGDCP